MYQALYRKYRPQTFDDVVGQRSVTETLKSQLVSGKLSHAYLFTGTRGTGKTTCAKILAKAVNCLDLQNGNPCNRCEACRAIDAGSCVDVLEIDAASNNGVDQVRALRDEAIYSPSQVRRRVYIIDEVHMLSISAFNALLKIIEEPPEHLLFILATTELHKVPATILSRCQRFSFRRLSAEDIADRIAYVAHQENIDLDPPAAELLSRLSGGALRDGLSLLDQCASASGGSVTMQSVYATLGMAGEDATTELLQMIADHDAGRALTEFSRQYDGGKDLSAMLGELSALARDLLVSKVAPGLEQGMKTDLRKRLAEALTSAELLRIVSTVQKTLSGFATSADRRLDTELCLIELCSPALTDDGKALSARVSRLEAQIASGEAVATKAQPAADTAKLTTAARRQEPARTAEEPAKPATPAPKTQPKAAPSDSGLPTGFWTKFSAAVAPQMSPQLRGFFTANGQLHPDLRGDTLVLEAQTEFVANLLNGDKAALARIRDHASYYLGKPVQVLVRAAGKNPLREEDPMTALLQFGGEHSDIINIKK